MFIMIRHVTDRFLGVLISDGLKHCEMMEAMQRSHSKSNVDLGLD